MFWPFHVQMRMNTISHTVEGRGSSVAFSDTQRLRVGTDDIWSAERCSLKVWRCVWRTINLSACSSIRSLEIWTGFVFRLTTFNKSRTLYTQQPDTLKCFKMLWKHFQMNTTKEIKHLFHCHEDGVFIADRSLRGKKRFSSCRLIKAWKQISLPRPSHCVCSLVALLVVDSPSHQSVLPVNQPFSGRCGFGRRVQGSMTTQLCPDFVEMVTSRKGH